METGKTTKYLKYAIGEIILVVIGILIALQINNWNNQQQNLKKEQEILKSLKAEFTQNLEELRRDHILNVNALNACFALLEIKKNTIVNPKTIDSLIGKSYDFATFDARIGVINNLSSSGNLELIRDPNLRFKLNQWTGELKDYSEDIIIRRNYWVNNFRLIDRYIPTRNIDASQNRPDYIRNNAIQPIEVPKQNYQEFINSLEVDGLLYNHYMNQSFVTINEESIEEFLNEIVELINQNIE
jgi:hypothetical protein